MLRRLAERVLEKDERTQESSREDKRAIKEEDEKARRVPVASSCPMGRAKSVQI